VNEKQRKKGIRYVEVEHEAREDEVSPQVVAIVAPTIRMLVNPGYRSFFSQILKANKTQSHLGRLCHPLAHR